MKSIASIFTVGIFALLLSTQANVESTHTAQAMEHAGMAQAHGEDGHAKVLLKHATAASSMLNKQKKHMLMHTYT